MIVGHTSFGGAFIDLAADQGYSMPFAMPTDGYASSITMALDGNGSGGGDQSLQAVLYGPDDVLIVASDIQVLEGGDDPVWVSFLIGPVLLRGGASYAMGLLAGPSAQGARLASSGLPGSGATYANTFAAGPASVLPSTTPGSDYTMFLDYSLPYTPPDGVTDGYLADLPFATAQSVFSATGVVPGTAQRAKAGWHGTLTDPDRGCFCLVRTDGPLAGLVGERLKVSYGKRVVYAYCHRDADILEDLSLTRRTFMALGYPATTALTVIVEVMAAAT